MATLGIRKFLVGPCQIGSGRDYTQQGSKFLYKKDPGP